MSEEQPAHTHNAAREADASTPVNSAARPVQRAPCSAREQMAADALRLWGVDAQLNMVVEECAELIQAIQHYRRKRVSAHVVALEVADVKLMMDQATWLLGPDLCEAALGTKVARLSARIEVADHAAWVKRQGDAGNTASPDQSACGASDAAPERTGVVPGCNSKAQANQ